jgi:hypothetical protein
MMQKERFGAGLRLLPMLLLLPIGPALVRDLLTVDEMAQRLTLACKTVRQLCLSRRWKGSAFARKKG